jgi:hypothetical protein
MDTTIDIKKRIIKFIDHADERILNIFNGIITAEEGKAPNFTGLEKKIIEVRREKKAGKLKTVNPKNVWESIL